MMADKRHVEGVRLESDEPDPRPKQPPEFHRNQAEILLRIALLHFVALKDAELGMKVDDILRIMEGRRDRSTH